MVTTSERSGNDGLEGQCNDKVMTTLRFFLVQVYIGYILEIQMVVAHDKPPTSTNYRF